MPGTSGKKPVPGKRSKKKSEQKNKQKGKLRHQAKSPEHGPAQLAILRISGRILLKPENPG